MKELTEQYEDLIKDGSIEWEDAFELFIFSEQYIRENYIGKEETNWGWTWMCYYQTLTEEFIREFQDKVDWLYISGNQKLSSELIFEFQDNIFFSELLYRNKLHDYNNATQLFILEKLIEQKVKTDDQYHSLIDDYYHHLTEYMKDQYEKLSMFL